MTVPARGRKRRDGLVLHLVRDLDPAQVMIRDRLVLTSPERTLLDLAETAPAQRVVRALDEAERLRLLDIGRLQRLIAGSDGRRGLAVLIPAAARLCEPAATNAELEHRSLEFCEGSGLPRPAVNVIVAGYEVDAVWPQARLVVELDGWTHHSTRAAFERDRLRDSDLTLAGYRVLRVTWRRLHDDPASVTEAIRRLLAGRAPASRSGQP